MPEAPNSEFTIPSFVGPLVWDEARREVATRLGIMPTTAGLLRFIGHPLRAGSLRRYASAYDEISAPEKEHPLFLVPFEPQLLEKLFWPLRSAKVAYILGNPLGTIALCGIVGEMVTVLTFDLACADWDEARQQREFSARFERLEQARRIRELRKRNLVSTDWAKALTELSDLRRPYLHLFSHIGATLKTDAIQAYRIALGLVSQCIGQGFSDGKLVLNDQIVEYLRKRGLVNATIEHGPITEIHFEDFDGWPPAE